MLLEPQTRTEAGAEAAIEAGAEAAIDTGLEAAGTEAEAAIEAGAGAAPRRTAVPGAAEALTRARDHLVSLQDQAGWWKAELETNVTMDAEDLLLRQFLGIRTEEGTAQTAAWIRSQQRSDGTWATFHGGPGDLSTTIESYAALRLAGDRPEDPHMARAAAFVLAGGGLERSRVFTRLWLALFGLWSWDDLPALPPEVVLLPPWVPLNIYDFACWARQTVVALTVVAAHRPARHLPFRLDELMSGAAPRETPPLTTSAGRFYALDRALHGYERRPVGLLRRLALRRAERWIVRRQEADGSWGGIQPPWVYSLMALSLQGYAVDHPVMRAGLEGIDRFTIHDERGRRLEACQSPVWDTCLAMIALSDAGLDAGDPTLRGAAAWLVDEEITSPGDWAVRRPHLAPSGWAFEFENDAYPDIDDTAEVIMALRRVVPATGSPVPPPPSSGSTEPGPATRSDALDRAVGESVERAVAWMEGMQSSDGGWAAFDVDNTRAAVNALPFCDFGEVIDPPSADVTAHTVEMLVSEPGHDRGRLARGVDWLWAAQEADGSWFGRWGVNHVYGTGAAVPALVAAGADPADERIRRAVAWLADHQNDDGGWGEDLRSYTDPSWRGKGHSTASQTAWALLALLAAGEQGPVTERGVAFLIETQRPDGTWDEPWYTGTGFPGDFSINYHLYRLIFPVTALGRYVLGDRAWRAGPERNRS